MTRTETDIIQIYEREHRLLYRISYSLLKNAPDAEDAVQETFCRMIAKAPDFENEAHERAWLIKTAENYCKSLLRHWWRRREPLEDHPELSLLKAPEADDVLQTVLALPNRLKITTYLYYYEGYKAAEIAEMLGRSPSAVRSALSDARKLLKERLGEQYDKE